MDEKLTTKRLMTFITSVGFISAMIVIIPAIIFGWYVVGDKSPKQQTVVAKVKAETKWLNRYQMMSVLEEDGSGKFQSKVYRLDTCTGEINRHYG